MNLFVKEKSLSYFSWLRLTLTLNARNRIPVRVIMKTFASGRNERIVYQSLKDLNLPHGKVCFKLLFLLVVMIMIIVIPIIIIFSLGL